MAVGVVEVLKVIQIEHKNPERLFGTNGAADFPLEHFLEVTAVV